MKNLTATITALLISLSISNVFAQELPMSLDENNVFWFNTESLKLENGDDVAFWNDNSGNGNNAVQGSHQYRPNYTTGSNEAINENGVVYFQGGNEIMTISNTYDINLGIYNEKSMMIFFRTSDQVNNMQVIYEEGGEVRGMNLYIHKGKLYSGLWNLAYDNGSSSYLPFTSIQTGIEANTSYMVELVFNANDDEFSMYVNGLEINTVNNIGTLYAHSGNIGIGGIAGYTVTHEGKTKNKNFKGSIGEFLFFDKALTEEEINALEDQIGPYWGFDHTGVLPVEMLEYSAHMENNSTIINWSTASELNNEYFTIERSDDMQNWIEIGTVYGSGNSSTRVDYEFVDYLPVNGTVYYRLSQTDFDGTTEIFNPFSVNSDNEGSGLSIENSYSNGNELRVEFSSETTDPVTIKIFSISGVVLAETTVNPVPGYNSVSLDVNASGIGIMKLSQRGEFQSEKTLLN